MNTFISEDQLISGEISARDWCDHLGSRFAQHLPPPKGSIPIYSWREFEWFWFKLSRPKAEAPGDWALMRSYDIHEQVSPAEGLVYGGSTLEFSREIALTTGRCAGIQTDEQYELSGLITTNLHGCYKAIIKKLEYNHGGINSILYSDPDELAHNGVSANLIKQRRCWLLEVIEAYLNIIVTFRITLPESNDLPNRKLANAILGGWIPVDYVGPLRTGSAVVFHPAIKGLT